MATTIQHNPVLLQQEDEDIALANYLTSSLKFDPQASQQQQQMNSANAYYFQQQLQKQQHRTRTRVSSSPSNPTRSSGTRKQPPPQTRPSNKKHPSSSSSIVSSSSLSQPPLISSNESMKSNNSRRRHSAMPMTQERRPSFSGSVVSATSALSIQSEMSVNTKLSLSKRLRKVFSMNNLKSSNSSQSDLASLASRNGSNSSIASSISSSPLSQSTTNSKNPMSFRRRSIASLSSLFQKGSGSVPQTEVVPSKPSTSTSSNSKRHSSGDLRQIVKEEKKEKKPDLRVDTTETTSHVRKGGLKGKLKEDMSIHLIALLVRSSSSNNTNNTYINGAPDSPNSAISTRSFTRLPPPQQQQQQRNFIHLPEPGLPSPTPSTASSKHSEEYIKPAAVGLQYGIGLHSSPKLKPASSSTSSLVAPTNNSGRRVQFCSTIQIHETFAPSDYDRRCDTNATCQKLTPMTAMKIKQELNEYKLTEMDVHVESRQYTHFFL
ncbi:uncharacterized protein B0P05DRAFT_535349 [Gilbertella persicaria]|nr:uncharacterized protein B0P05DRAFT_535349 [Gilbertella persicaria]KAI8084376.1 hypothetical protein B0P05DRAFT_535349 [Gilbertella persicaria]